MQAYRETLDWMYASPDALRLYAEFAGTSDANAKRIRDEFFAKEMLDPDRISGVEALMADGVKFKFIAAPLTADQLARAIQIPPRRGS
jgi:NitT/TauT family transport system substrate-binding protein